MLYGDGETGRMLKPWQCTQGTVMAEYLYIPRSGAATTLAVPQRCSTCKGRGCDCPPIANLDDKPTPDPDEA